MTQKYFILISQQHVTQSVDGSRWNARGAQQAGEESPRTSKGVFRVAEKATTDNTGREEDVESLHLGRGNPTHSGEFWDAFR